MRKNRLSIISFFLLFIALIGFVFLPIVNVSAASSNRYYSGYYYYGYGGSAPEGVQASIYTKNTGIPPWFEFVAEWDTIIINYNPNYWVQLGYIIHWVWIIFPFATVDFYKEKMDSNGRGFSLLLPLKPLFGHTYKYKLLLSGTGEFSYYVYEGTTTIYSGTISVAQYTTRDLQAFVETTHTNIKIDGSHFTSLKYRQSGSSWPLWNRHYGYRTSPYSLNQISHYEFKASGGG